MIATDKSDPMTPPPSAHTAAVPDGEAFIWQPYPGIVVQKSRGAMSLPLAHCVVDFYRPLLKPGVQLTTFVDLEQLTHYTREARECLTEFSLAQPVAIKVLHFLLASKFVALGVGVLRHDIGDERLRVYSDRGSFLQSYANAVRQFT